MKEAEKQNHKNIHTIGIRQDSKMPLELEVLQFAHIVCFSHPKKGSELFMSIIRQGRKKNQSQLFIYPNKKNNSPTIDQGIKNLYKIKKLQNYLPADLYSLIERIYNSILEREKAILMAKVNDFEEYNCKNVVNSMPHQILAINNWELAWTFLAGFYQNGSIIPNSPLDMLLKILQKGRFCGCSVIIMAKEPYDKNIPNQIKNQIPVKIISTSEWGTLNYFGLSQKVLNHPITNDNGNNFYIKNGTDLLEVQALAKD